jgi:hypothetical protein
VCGVFKKVNLIILFCSFQSSSAAHWCRYK